MQLSKPGADGGVVSNWRPVAGLTALAPLEAQAGRRLEAKELVFSRKPSGERKGGGRGAGKGGGNRNGRASRGGIGRREGRASDRRADDKVAERIHDFACQKGGVISIDDRSAEERLSKRAIRPSEVRRGGGTIGRGTIGYHWLGLAAMESERNGMKRGGVDREGWGGVG